MKQPTTVRITIDVEIEPDVDASVMQIASAVVLSALHDASLFPHRLVIEEPAPAHPHPTAADHYRKAEG